LSKYGQDPSVCIEAERHSASLVGGRGLRQPVLLIIDPRIDYLFTAWLPAELSYQRPCVGVTLQPADTPNALIATTHYDSVPRGQSPDEMVEYVRRN
jgi:hypothetical protein